MTKIDPILVTVLERKLQSIAREMGLTLLHTTRSPVFNEAKDFATGLFDAQGRVLEQHLYIPLLALVLKPACEHIIKYFGDDIHPGDVILHNDVFYGGNQYSDVGAFKPIFFGDKLIGWSASKGHQADIGGPVAGGVNPRATEAWQEALRITPVKLFDRGEFRRDVWDLIFANIRFPFVADDVRAEMGAAVVGERGLHALAERYGVDVFQAHVEHLFDSTERVMRKEIRSIPSGRYRGEATIYDDGLNPDARCRVSLTVIVEGDEITFDFTGTDPQTPAFVNAPYAASFSATLLAFMMCIDPSISLNEGMLRPVHLVIPEGSVLNASFPAATTYGNHFADPIAECVFKALAPAIPERVSAGWNRLLGTAVTGWDPRKRRHYHDVLFLCNKGGSGGTYGADGWDHIGTIEACGSILSQDYEMFELHDPHFLLKHEYQPDSAGAGQWRGGLGIEGEFVFEGDDALAAVYGDGVVEGAFGLFGGKPGSRNWVQLVSPDGTVYQGKSKELVKPIARGSIWRKEAGGGGGFGDPFLRPVAKVLKDIKNETLSIEKARDDYGVVLDPRTGAVDAEATARLRSRKEK
ncbi:MAG: hydantoinase B/oxoprolinase family protein [Chloroflexi bacterium]|nr:hydantoinase B/oxoprolinase family protein [Chloroflexota bacterium]